MSAERAANPYDINWGGDFTQVAVRYGWPIAWERSWPRVGQTRSSVTGRDLPTAFRAFPPREVLDRGAAGEEPVAWEESDDHPRASYLPPYLDSLDELDAQVGRFWRPGHIVLEGTGLGSHGSTPRRRSGGVGGGATGRRRREHPGLRSTPRTRSAGPRSVGALRRARGVTLAAGSAHACRAGEHRAAVGPMSPGTDWGVVSLEAWAPDLRSARRHRAGHGVSPVAGGTLFAAFRPGAPRERDSRTLGPAAIWRACTAPGPRNRCRVRPWRCGPGGLRPRITRREMVQFSARVEGRGRRTSCGALGRAAAPRGSAGAKFRSQWREEGPTERWTALQDAAGRPLRPRSPAEYALVVEVSAPGRVHADGYSGDSPCADGVAAPQSRSGAPAAGRDSAFRLTCRWTRLGNTPGPQIGYILLLCTKPCTPASHP